MYSDGSVCTQKEVEYNSGSIQKKAMVMEYDLKTHVFIDAQRTSYNISEGIDFKTIGTTSNRLLTGL